MIVAATYLVGFAHVLLTIFVLYIQFNSSPSGEFKEIRIMNTNELPSWTEETKVEFKHASLLIKNCAKMHNMSPRWFAVQGSGKRQIVYVWNTRRAEKFDDNMLSMAWELQH